MFRQQTAVMPAIVVDEQEWADARRWRRMGLIRKSLLKSNDPIRARRMRNASDKFYMLGIDPLAPVAPVAAPAQQTDTSLRRWMGM